MADSWEARQRAGSLEALRALAHPLRLRMWSLLVAAPATAAELARALDVQHASASYHLRSLHDAGLVALAEVRTVNGGVERRFRVVDPPEQPVAGEPTSAEDWVALVAALSATLQQRAARVGTAPKWFADSELWAPADAVETARQRIHAALRDLQQAAVTPGGAAARRVSASALIFEIDEQRPDRG